MVISDLVIGALTDYVIEDSTKGVWEKVKKFFKDLDAKESIKYRTAYEKYLKNMKEKNSKIKTIIYRRVPQYLYSFYECIGVFYNGNILDANSIKNLIENATKIIITGIGGSGKSILFKHLFLNTIEETDYIPVLIELRSFNTIDIKEISLYESIYNSLVNNGFILSEEYFEYSMAEGGYVIFLDGFDEVNKERTTKITEDIINISEKYNKNNYIMSSRPTEEFIGWNDFTEMETLKLSKKQALSLINKIEFDESVKKKFYNELEKHLYDKYESFAANPLLLNIMLLTFDKHASIPDRLNDFYEEAFAVLYNMHDATKNSYVRDIRCGLGCEDFKMVFSYICFKSYFSGENEFSEAKLREYLQLARNKFSKLDFTIEDFQEDLTMSVCMLVKDGLNYRFSHRSFQEYFAAWYTCKLLDETQSRLLTNWLKESQSVFTDSYFEMLFELQSEKVNKLLLCPALKEIQRFYQVNGFTVEFLEKLFNGISIVKDNENVKNNYKLSLTIKNHYLCSSLLLNNKLNDYTPSDTNLQNLQDLCEELMNTRNNKFKTIRNVWNFREIITIVGEDKLIKSLKMFESQILFAITILEKNSDNSLNKKKKVASIIQEL